MTVLVKCFIQMIFHENELRAPCMMEPAASIFRVRFTFPSIMKIEGADSHTPHSVARASRLKFCDFLNYKTVNVLAEIAQFWDLF
jgi:hypothetical protein